MKIINSTKNLAREISHIYVNSWKAAYKNIISPKYLDDLSIESLTPFFENSPYQNFLLQDNGVFVATASIGKARDSKYDGCGEIISIYVLPKYFGKGYGTFLFNHMVEKLQSMGLSKIYLWVLEENRNARQFYEKMGFATNEDKKVVNIGGKDLTEICYLNTLEKIVCR